MIKTVVIRHPREKLSKCSLTPLHGRPEITFLKSSPEFTFDASGYVMLEVGAPPLSEADAGLPVLVLDATWRLLPGMLAQVQGAPIRRSIPDGVKTAYPRVGKSYPDPHGGLASVEALFVARALMGDLDESLLDGYYWREAFLAQLPEWEAFVRGR